MEKILFREEQRFDQLWVRVVIILAWIPLAWMFGTGIYRQHLLGKPCGNNPASDSGLLIMTVIIFVVMTGVTLLLFSLKLITEVTEEVFRFRFPPVIFRFRDITKYEIEEYSIREYRPVSEYGGWGIRLGRSGTGKAYNVKGKTGLQFYLKNGKKVLFGTQRPDALLSSMDKMMKPSRQ